MSMFPHKYYCHICRDYVNHTTLGHSNASPPPSDASIITHLNEQLDSWKAVYYSDTKELDSRLLAATNRVSQLEKDLEAAKSLIERLSLLKSYEGYISERNKFIAEHDLWNEFLKYLVSK